LRNGGGSGNHWLSVVARRPNGKSDAVGARVTVAAGKLVQIHDAATARGYMSQSDPRAHFGLGKAAKADRVEIRWPDGRKTELTDVPADRILKVVQPPEG
jgi:hypothetical protein